MPVSVIGPALLKLALLFTRNDAWLNPLNGVPTLNVLPTMARPTEGMLPDGQLMAREPPTPVRVLPMMVARLMAPAVHRTKSALPEAVTAVTPWSTMLWQAF